MSALPIKTIYCVRSGLPLASVTALCSSGWPLLQTINTSLLHPIYNMPLSGLLVKFKHHLDTCEEAGWFVPNHEIVEVKLCMSAIMYQLDAIWLPPIEAVHLWQQLEPSLPMESVATASANRLFKLARWYHYATSKRMEFPRYRISKKNDNLQWQNFSAWLDDAFSIKTEWERGRKELEREHQLRLRTEALHTINSEAVYKRIDFNKVWNWIDIQLAVSPKYPLGRRVTFKSLFMSGDMKPEEWTLDDVEDVQMAVLECCDMGNEISHFINKRLSHIRAMIRDFYSGFTLLNDVSGKSEINEAQSEREREAEQQLFAEYDRKITDMAELPPEPTREQYPTLGRFLQAQAQHRILVRRFEESKKRSDTTPDPLKNL